MLKVRVLSYDDDTEVTLIPDDGSIEFMRKEFNASKPLVVKLSKKKVLRLVQKNDLSGMLVKSSKPVHVYVASRYRALLFMHNILSYAQQVHVHVHALKPLVLLTSLYKFHIDMRIRARRRPGSTCLMSVVGEKPSE